MLYREHELHKMCKTLYVVGLPYQILIPNVITTLTENLNAISLIVRFDCRFCPTFTTLKISISGDSDSLQHTIKKDFIT